MPRDEEDRKVGISANDARGARGTESGTAGDTLLPMLIGGLVLMAFGALTVWMIV